MFYTYLLQSQKDRMGKRYLRNRLKQFLTPCVVALAFTALTGQAEAATPLEIRFLTGGQLVVGTEKNADSATAAAAEGVNTGSWKGTLADDAFHWVVTGTTTGVDVQLTVGNVALNGANTLMIQTDFDLDNAALATVVQICDWVSATGVDNAADAQCTTGGWRTLNNRKTPIVATATTSYHWQIYDGYCATGNSGRAGRGVLRETISRC